MSQARRLSGLPCLLPVTSRAACRHPHSVVIHWFWYAHNIWRVDSARDHALRCASVRFVCEVQSIMQAPVPRRCECCAAQRCHLDFMLACMSLAGARSSGTAVLPPADEDTRDHRGFQCVPVRARRALLCHLHSRAVCCLQMSTVRLLCCKVKLALMKLRRQTRLQPRLMRKLRSHEQQLCPALVCVNSCMVSPSCGHSGSISLGCVNALNTSRSTAGPSSTAAPPNMAVASRLRRSSYRFCRACVQ